jgi:copper transporter 1
MYFHLSSNTLLFFEGWSLNSASSKTYVADRGRKFVFYIVLYLSYVAAIAGATIALLVIAALYEGLKFLRERIMRQTLEDVAERELEGHKTTCCKAEGSQKEYIRLPLLSHVLQTILHMIQIFVSYLLMLAVMTYNVWLFLGVLVGSGIGYFAMSWYMPRSQQSSVSAMSEHCN